MAEPAKPEAPAAKYEPQKEQPKTAQAQKNVGRPKRTPEEQAEYFYSRKIHLIFFLASAAMFVSFILMFIDDNDRTWKKYQRVFAEMDLAKLQDDIKKATEELKSDQGTLKDLDARIQKFYDWFPKDGSPKETAVRARVPGDVNGAFVENDNGEKVHVYLEIDGDKKKVRMTELDEIAREFYDKKMRKNFAQSDYLAFRWRFEEAKHNFEERKGDPRLPEFERHFREVLPHFMQIVDSRDKTKLDFDKIEARQNRLLDLQASLQFDVNARIKERDTLKKEVAEKERRLEKEKPSLANTIRNLPILDFFGPTIKIEQQILPAVREDLNFVKVERIDRCKTCHKGIGDPAYAAYDVDAFGRFRDPLIQRVYDEAKRDIATYSDENYTQDDKLEKLTDAQKRLEGLEKIKGEFRSEFLRKYCAEMVDVKHKWSVDDKKKYIQMFKAHPRLDLYVTSSSAHSLDRVGCTVCHGGDGRETEFSLCVHTPNDPDQRAEWERRDHYHHRELWDDPMLPTKYIEASCRRCHAQQVELDGAPEYTKAMRLYEKVGCYACHRTDAYAILPKDTSEPGIDPNRKYRRPGPPFTHLKAKLTPEWAYKWVLNPKDFRPTTQMPRFFGQSNARTLEIDKAKYGPEIVEAVIAECIIQYVFDQAKDRADPDPPKLTGRKDEGEKIFKQIGCMACHRAEPMELKPRKEDKPVEPNDFAGYDLRSGPSYHLDSLNFGPNLATIGSKLSGDKGRKWLYNWVREPHHHFPETRMPNLRLDEQMAMDVVEFLLSKRDTKWEERSPKRPNLEQTAKILDYLVLEQKKAKMPVFQAEQELNALRANRTEEALWFGQRMVANFGCFSCHEMNRDDKTQLDWRNTEGIGVELTGSQPEGVKAVDRLDFGYTHYDGVNHKGVSFSHAFTGQAYVHRDPENKDPKTVRVHETRHDWIINKLLDPRVFDGGKLASKPPDELLRMPNFNLTEYESYLLTLLVLSFTDHDVKDLVSDAKKRLSPDEVALNRGNRIVREHNCRSCHRFALDSFEIEWKRKEIKDGVEKEKVNYVWVEGVISAEFGAESSLSTLRGWKLAVDPPTEVDKKKRLYMYSWASDHRDLMLPPFLKPSSIVYYDGREWWLLDQVAGDIRKPDPKRSEPGLRIRNARPMEGGDVMQAIYDYKKEHLDDNKIEPDREGKLPNDRMQSRYPPMLRTQGVKTQTDWLFNFLKNPTPIRPALQPIYPGKKGPLDLNVRMPTFGFNDEEAGALTRFFAVRDQLPDVDSYPFTFFPERDEALLVEHKALYEKSITPLIKNTCMECHYVDGAEPPAPPKDTYKFAPELAYTGARLRPRWLYKWFEKPSAIYPGTTMLSNFGDPDKPAGDKEGLRPLDRDAGVEMMLNWRRLWKP